MSDPAPNRRWFRWSLRTLFVVVAVVCIWLGYYANRVHQRREFIANPDKVWNHEIRRDVPWALQLLGAEKVDRIWLRHGASTSEMEYAGALFPEADIDLSPPPDPGAP